MPAAPSDQIRVGIIGSGGRGQFLMPFAGGSGGTPRTVLQRAMAKRRLTPPGDVDALVAALEPLMRDPALAVEMGRRGRARVLEKFSLGAEANRIADLYRALG